MDQLCLSEPLQAEDIIIGSQGVVVRLNSRCELTNQVSSLVHVLVLVQLVNIKLQVLLRLGKT